MAIVYKEESYSIIGACFEVHREMGSGFLESVYQECLCFELTSRRILFIAQQGITLSYKTEELKQKFVPDFLCYQKIILEIKAVQSLTDQYRAQIHNYLKATGHRLGLLVNFGSHDKLEYERIVR